MSNTGGIALNGSVSGGGMDLITPTSVAGSGVTFSGGAISFSAATSISVNGIFSSAYDNYKLVYAGIASVSSWNDFRFRASGTDASGGNYYSELLDVTGATVSSTRQSAGTSQYAFYSDVAGAYVSYEATIFSPFLTAYTNTISSANGGHTVITLRSVSAQHALANSYDGFTFITASGSITGKLRVYGLRNS